MSSKAPAGEIVFYHLERTPLEKALPKLLEKVVERGWKAVVETGSSERLGALDTALWNYSDDGFLPHGIAGGQNDGQEGGRDGGQNDGQEDAAQPIILISGPGNPNGANVRFFVQGAIPDNATGYERVLFMFDGHDPECVTRARTAWKSLKDSHTLTYWQQDQRGAWVKKG
jgi:DNA polymerase III subunit chi